MIDHKSVTFTNKTKNSICNCLSLCDMKMKIRNVRFVELIIIIILFWTTCWFFFSWLRSPSIHSSSSSSVSSFNGHPVTGHSRVGDFPAEHKDSGLAMKTPVYIVEEHHEVIKYWYAAANQGYIPKKGNVLLHIDGHSDGATPFKWMLGPLFRFPVSQHELTNMMQENDVFVVASALTGLLSRYIWVWPSWNTDSAEGQSDKDYISVHIRYGSMYRKDIKTGRFVIELCGCASSKEFNLDNYCFMNNASDFEDMDGIPIKESECSIKYTGLIEVVSEMKAISLIKTGAWITEKDNVLLDVDEDFYGVEPAIMPLYDAGLEKVTVDDISSLVAHLVCASNTHQERQTDSFLNYLIQTIIDFKIVCLLNGTTNDNVCSNSNKLVSSLTSLLPMFLKDLRERNLDRHLCDDNKSKIVLKILILKFCSMNIDQLKAFIEVGFCLNQSPKTLGFQKTDSMRVCHGYNTPNDSMVMFYVPSLTEIEQRTDNLKDILKQKQFAPGAVTICRSTRDGYTPKKYFSKIESDIKQVLRDVFPRILEDSFYYDEDLLGGPFGWYGRH